MHQTSEDQLLHTNFVETDLSDGGCVLGKGIDLFEQTKDMTSLTQFLKA